MTFSPMPTSLEEAKKEILMWRELHRSKAAQPAQVPRWRAIESAPKDEAVLLAVEFDGPGDWRIKCGWGDERGWHVWGASWKPTHWMPLPAAPSTKEDV